MPKQITGADLWTDPITIPVDGEPMTMLAPGNGGTEPVYQSLANRDQNLANRLSIVETKIALLDTLVPIGLIIAFGGGTWPGAGTVWFECNGQALSRTTYATLYGELGTTWGAGDGSATFNVPNIQGRGLVGAGLGVSLSARTLGQLIGAETHSPTLLSHTHSVVDPQHGHGYTDNGHNHAVTDTGHFHGVAGTVIGAVGAGFNSAGNGTSQFSSRDVTGIAIQNNVTGITIARTATGISVAAAGDSAVESNMPPGAVVHFLIRAA